MALVAAILAGLFGLLIGSFLNACVYRLPRDISLLNPSRSFCPACEKTIAWYDNLPVVSYIFLRGRCRHCEFQIPIRYLWVEILCGIMYFVIVYRFGLTPLSLKLAIFGSINLELIASDLEERILPDEFTKGGVLAGLILSWFVWLPDAFAFLFLPSGSPRPVYSLVESATGAAFAYGSLWFIGWAYRRFRGREGMGLGDLKMAAMIGAFLGLTPMLMALMAGSILGSVVGLIYIKISNEESATYELPFGSFLGFAALAVAWMEASRLSG